jgi:HAD superfamily hydrolase (TIGR01484 family)
MDRDMPPLVLDIDGTLTDAAGRLDPRVPRRLQDWNSPVILATGKAFPYPVSLCHFMGIKQNVIAENGGVVLADQKVKYEGDRKRVTTAIEEFEQRGGTLGWGSFDDVNKWRETEIAVSLSADESLLRDVASAFDLEVVDTGFAYHIKSPEVSKGNAVETVSTILDIDLDSTVAIGDSENDVSTFAVTGTSYAVHNADQAATEAADNQLTDSYFDGTASVLDKYST